METDLMLHLTMAALAVSACANILFGRQLLRMLLPQMGYRSLPKTTWGMVALAFAHTWRTLRGKGTKRLARDVIRRTSDRPPTAA